MTSPCLPPISSKERRARERLDRRLGALSRPLVALSGGTDSVLLAARAAAAKVDAAAATLTGALFAREEEERAAAMAERLEIPHWIIPFPALEDPAIRRNPPDRCYHCKKAGLGRLIDWARENGFGAVLDGRNVDDDDDYRPGTRAAEELGVLAPLREAGLTKAMIRRWSRELALPTADVPSSACLASRIPHGTPLTEAALRRVDAAERFLRESGWGRQVRVRAHGDLARIEAEPDAMAKLSETPWRSRAASALEDLGFRYVAVDLTGYRMGSLNPVSERGEAGR